MELNRLKIILKGAGIDATKGLLYKTGEFESDIAVKTSALGTEVFTNLSFLGGSFVPLGGGIPINFNSINIDTVLMTVSMTKNIVTTPIQGKAGTVKEYVSDGDYQIDVRGILTSDGGNTYPTDLVEQMTQIFTIPDSLRITSEFLNHFGTASPKGLSGIDEVVITDFNFPQQEGFRNQQLFTCKMISDSPIELII
jgi:hypothetical protein